VTKGKEKELQENIGQADRPAAGSSSKDVRRDEEDDHFDLGNNLVEVLVAKEKGGMMFFRYSLFVIRSEHARRARIVRRFSDFEWLQDTFAAKYPFRLVPSLPARHTAEDPYFIEERRRGLAKFLDFLLRHPVLNRDELLLLFLREQNTEAFHQRMKNLHLVDEFHFSEVARLHPKNLIPHDAEEVLRALETRLPVSRAQFSKLLDVLERFINRNLRDSFDFGKFGALFE